MADPVTTLTFQKFLESGSGELAKKFTAEAIEKMGELWEKIKTRLLGQNPKLDEALQRSESGDRTAVATVSKYLDVAMEEQPEFASELQELVQVVTNLRQSRRLGNGNRSKTD